MMATLAPAVSAATVKEDAVVKKAEKAYATDRVLVKMKEGKDIAGVAAKANGQAKKLGKSDWQLVKLNKGNADEVLAQLQADPNVESVEFDYVMNALTTTPNDPRYGAQYHLPKIQANLAWDQTKGTTARTIAIIDTGVDHNHADVKSKLVAGYDFVNNDTLAQDDHGHGTHCAGIAAGLTNNALDAAGVDWNARVMPVKVLDAAGSGYTSDIVEGVYWAVDHGAHVISMSLGGGGATQSFQDAINYAWNSGRIVVAAAGNSNTSAKSYPAAYNNVVAVASTTSTDARSSFSNYGTWVDIAAPGSSIEALRLGGGTTVMSGTSMATPVVAGVMSLAWSKNTGYSNATVVNRVLSTADVISGTGTYWLNGRVNAYRAVNGF